MADGSVHEGEINVASLASPAQMLAIPVRFRDRTIGVLTRERTSISGRQPGELERTYLSLFDRFATMIAQGSFPFPGRIADSSAAPRVGDGAMVLDVEGRVRYASPNAVSALHGVGISANAVGMRLAELGFNDSSVRQAYERSEPVIQEFDQNAEVTLLSRCIPIIDHGEVTGGILLMRDVTELRKRDRMLLSKDATIREIHHRVKNNLQTVASLLRLRAGSGDPARALEDSVDRVLSIAEVHDLLTASRAGEVDLSDLVRRLAAMLGHGLGAEPAAADLDPIEVPGETATAVALIFCELYANALQHGGGDVTVRLARENGAIELAVRDHGRGLPEPFDPGSSLGLKIAGSLARDDLGGSLDLMPAGPGTRATVRWIAR
jgi:two-component sensor histidine kinase